MQPLFEKIPITRQSSFKIREFKLPKFNMPLHFHPELELTWIVAGKGQRIVGDSITEYDEGDLVMIGPNLSHYWYSDLAYAKAKQSHSVVVHFDEDFLGKAFFNVPEMAAIHKFLIKTYRGIKVDTTIKNEITGRMQELLVLNGSRSIFKLLEILDILAQSEHHTVLSSEGFNKQVNSSDCERMNKICQFVFENFTTAISLQKAASIIHMNPPAFCFYFKKRTGKTFSQFVNEVRIGHACRLLIETDQTISQICFASGFNNLSNFNRRFKALQQVSPSCYRGVVL